MQDKSIVETVIFRLYSKVIFRQNDNYKNMPESIYRRYDDIIETELGNTTGNPGSVLATVLAT